jgi:hypothetical protein
MRIYGEKVYEGTVVFSRENKTYEGVIRPINVPQERYVTVNGLELNPRHDLRNHSPDGFNWGYSGSGPTQLALAILADHLNNDEEVLSLYTKFRDIFVSKLEMTKGWTVTSSQIQQIVDLLSTADVVNS